MGSPHPHHQRPRAHPAHPQPPAHIQEPPPPPAPPGLRAENYLLSIITTAGGAIARWNAFAQAIDSDYFEAYTQQAAALKAVKESLEGRRKDQEAALNFALNILTIGVAGGIATAAEKYVVGAVAHKAAKANYSEEGIALLKKFSGGVSDKVSDKIADQVKEAGEWAYKFGHPPMEDAFKPPGVEPAKFGHAIRDKIEPLASELQTMIEGFGSPEIQRTMTTESAKAWYETILNTPFVREAPAQTIRAGTMTNCASAALWIAWAWDRDRAYWRRQSTLGVERNAVEELDFEPVRRALDACGVPAVVINKSAGRTNWEWIQQDRQAGETFKKMQEEQKVDWQNLQVIDMDHFITWANTADVTGVLFSNNLLKLKNRLWFDEVAKRIRHRQRYGLMARYVPMDYGVFVPDQF